MRNHVVLFVGKLLYTIGMLCISKYSIGLATVGGNVWILVVGIVFCLISIIIKALNIGEYCIKEGSVVAGYMFFIAVSVAIGVEVLNIIFGNIEKRTTFAIIGVMFGLMAVAEIIDMLKRFIKG